MPARKAAPLTHNLSERLLKLSIETRIPRAYEVTDHITVAPLTKKRGTELAAAHTKLMVNQTLLQAAVQQANTPRPKLSDDADEAEQAAHDKAIAEWEADVKANEETLKSLSDSVSAAIDEYNRVFFGDAHDAVMEFFEDQPQVLWDAFVDDIKTEFLPSQPRNGLCPTCGQVTDAEEAGKASSSSI